MGGLSKTYVNEISLERIKGILYKSYNVVKEESLDIEQDCRYCKYGNETIILCKNYHSDWVELQFDFANSLYEHDSIIEQISKQLGCIVLVCYFDSTSGHGRFAKFTNGSCDLSIVQKVTGNGIDEQMTLIDNLGVTDEFNETFKIPNQGDKFFGINYDTAYKYFSYFGLDWDGKKRETLDYIHLEINK